MRPLSKPVQIHRCNTRLKFEVDLFAIPTDIDLVNLTWFKDFENQTISYADTRIELFKSYRKSWLQKNGSIRAGISIYNLAPTDSGLYTLRASLMNGVITQNETLDLKVITCDISAFTFRFNLYNLIFLSRRY